LSTSQKTEFLPPVAVKSSISAQGVFEGYGSTFGGDPDSYGDVIAPGAFAASLKEHAAKGTRPALLWHHDLHEPIGAWTSLSEDAYGLKGFGKLTLKSRRGEEAYGLMQDGALSLSIGYRTRKSTFGANGVRILQDVDVREISVVSIPANTSARITAVKSDLIDIGDIEDARDFEKMLRSLGFPQSFAKTAAAAGFNAAARVAPKSDRVELARKLIAAAEKLSRKD